MKSRWESSLVCGHRRESAEINCSTRSLMKDYCLSIAMVVGVAGLAVVVVGAAVAAAGVVIVHPARNLSS